MLRALDTSIKASYLLTSYICIMNGNALQSSTVFELSKHKSSQNSTAINIT